MDLAEQDDHNFSSSSSHRLPTISGIEAIRNAQKNAKPIPTSLTQLDDILRQASVLKTSSSGGIQRGVVTEIFGPPGIGKTTFAIQVAVNAICEAEKEASITWIDTSSQLIRSRVRQIIDAYRLPLECELPSSPPEPQRSTTTKLSENFNYLHITSLPRLLTLLMHPSEGFPPKHTDVIVLDDLSNLILSSLPRTVRPNLRNSTQKTPSSIQDAVIAKNILSRRFQVLSNFAASLQKFAVKNNVAVVVISKATMNLRIGQRALLRPALNSQQWDNSLSVRIALFRDFWPENHFNTQEKEDQNIERPTDFERRSLRIAKVVKLGGKLVSCPGVGFVIEEGGLRGIQLQQEAEPSVLPLATQPLHLLEDVLDPAPPEDDEAGDGISCADDCIRTAGLDNSVAEAAGATKRKAIEIADSEEEDGDIGDSDDDSSLSAPALEKSGMLMQSQGGDIDPHTTMDVSFSTAKKLRTDHLLSQDGPDSLTPVLTRAQTTRDEKVVDEEMLLEAYERPVPLLSQAVAEMSEPLTPSDDGRDIS